MISTGFRVSAVRSGAVLLGGIMVLTSCASTTIIQSTPSQARVYLNGKPVGHTPYTHSGTRIVGSTTTVGLEKEEFEPFYTSFSRDEQVDVGAVVAGVFFLIPFLWIMKYKPNRFYEMKPLQEGKERGPSEQVKHKYF